MKSIKIPEMYNYIACFLTLRCNLSCSYCINTHRLSRGTQVEHYEELDGKAWIKHLNRIEAREDLPITLQGGEPTLHPAFYDIINEVKRPIDILTNGQFDVDEFISKIPPKRLRRTAPYASIRISYHPETMDLVDTITTATRLKDAGYSVGVWMIEFPDKQEETKLVAHAFMNVNGIDFRLKSLLGTYKGAEYGRFKYSQAMDQPSEKERDVLCRPSELIIGPNGGIFRCHSDLYNLRTPIDWIDTPFVLSRAYRSCVHFGSCSACDIKVKTNRFQQFGHTSVDIKFLPDKSS